MILMTCQCLNVRVHGRGSSIPCLEDANSMNISEAALSDSFFASGIYSVTLDLAGVTMSQKLLCKVRPAGEWTVTTCTCCALDVYAKYSDEEDKVLVSSRVEKENGHIFSLMSSDNYSSLFKLLLPEINDNFIHNNIGIELHNQNLDQSIEHVQNQVSNYLKDEQKAMEERIRQFTEQQHSRYADLLQKVRKHKQAMVYLLLKAKEGEKQPDPDEAIGESPLASPASVANRDIANESSTSTDSAFDRSETSECSHERNIEQQNVRVLRRAVSNPGRLRPKQKTSRKIRQPPQTVDVGGVFDMEEFDPRELYSEEESDESDNSNLDDTVIDKQEVQLYATSLPMSIPAFSKFSHFAAVEDDDKESPPKGPEEMAASMRALAWSVRDGTEMFGELPRRRLNTGELLAARPL